MKEMTEEASGLEKEERDSVDQERMGFGGCGRRASALALAYVLEV